MDDNTTVAASKEQVFCDLQGDTAILNLKNSTYYGLNPVGARIWEWIQSPIRIADLCENVTNEYDVEPERAASDISALLVDMERHQLVTFSQ